MTKKTTVNAMKASGLFHFRRDNDLECYGENYTACREWLQRHLGEKNVFPWYDPQEWEIHVEIEGGAAIWCHA